jgi:predicted nucleotidyltransferase
VHTALVRWARALAEREHSLRAVGYFGSYARGDWGPGSDVDVVAVLTEDDTPPLERARRFDTASLPVPADLLIYTAAELDEVRTSGTRFADVLRDEVRWVYPRG